MSKRLLVVDDEPNLLVAVGACLRGEGFDVVTARSGAEALVRVAESVPDLVVSDMRMPGMDGYQLARQLRASPRTALTPVVFLTAKDETTDRIEGFRTGVDAYLTKPFEPDELVAVIRGILDRVQRTHAEIARLVGSQDGRRAACPLLRRGADRGRGARRRGRRARPLEQGDRRRVPDQRPHGRESHQPHPRQEGLRQPRRDRPLRP